MTPGEIAEHHEEIGRLCDPSLNGEESWHTRAAALLRALEEVREMGRYVVDNFEDAPESVTTAQAVLYLKAALDKLEAKS